MPALIKEMEDAAFRLIEASKTSSGKPSMTGAAINNREMARVIQGWAADLRKIKVIEVVA